MIAYAFINYASIIGIEPNKGASSITIDVIGCFYTNPTTTKSSTITTIQTSGIPSVTSHSSTVASSVFTTLPPAPGSSPSPFSSTSSLTSESSTRIIIPTGESTTSPLQSTISSIFSSTTSSSNLPCLYSDWSQWSSCSSLCGNGTSHRSRTVLSGVNCLDSLIQVESCFSYNCYCNISALVYFSLLQKNPPIDSILFFIILFLDYIRV
jgi:hypothetical protein